MLNIIKADVYRLFKGKGFYITMALLIAFIVLQTVARGSVELLTFTDEISESSVIEEITGPGDFTGDETGGLKMLEPDPANYKFTGTETMVDTDILLYFLLPFIIFIAAADFSTGTVKNVLANGMSRKKYYFSKLLLSCVFCFLILSLNIVIPIITMGIASMIPAFAAALHIQPAAIFKPFFAQLFMCLAVTCAGVFFVFATKRTAAVNGAYIAFCFVPLLLVFTLYQINSKLQFLFNYDLVSNIRMLAGMDTAASADIIRAFIIGGFYILASTAGGIAVFQKSEIK